MNKYGNKKTVVGDMEFDSKHEAQRYIELMLLVRAHQIDDLQRQVPFELIPRQSAPDGKVVRPVNYVADFVYKNHWTGEMVVEDAKGFMTTEYKIKKKMMYHKYGIWVREV